ncbi:MAG: hypothetical protein ACRD3W_29095, partial [Terriglobales bacterium]
AGGAGENLYMRGAIGSDGVWQPIRDVHELPLAGKRQLVGLFKGVGSPLLEQANVNAFVQQTAGVLDRFTPLPADASQTEVIGRAKQLLDSINGYAKERGIPKFKLSITDAEKDSALVSGKMFFDREEGALGINRVDLLQNQALGSAPQDVFISRLYHEVNHGQQVSDVFANHANLMRLPKTGETDPIQVREIQEDLNSNLGGVRVSDSYLQRLVDNYRSGAGSTEVPSNRAVNLMRGFIKGREPGPEYAQAVPRIQQSTLALQQLDTTGGAQSVLQTLSTSEGQSAIFGSPTAVPQPVRGLIDGTAGSGAEAKSILGQALNDNIGALNDLRQARYSKYMGFHEIESWLVQQKALIAARKFGV